MGYAMSDDLGYKKLEIWKLSRDASILIHRMTLEKLPKFEHYETGSQIRRSSKSIRAIVVEGYGKRVWKADFIRHLRYALGSCDETIDHLETLQETNSLTDQATFKEIFELLDHLKRKLVNFTRAVETGHKSEW